MASPRLLLGLASLASVLWLFVLQVDHVSPGPISATHAREDELLGRGSCTQCHGRGEHAMAQACGECHETILTDIDSDAGFHGTLTAEIEAEDCARCHFEHSGAGFALVNEQSFVRAGFEGRADYDHAALDFELEGRHATLTCTECHANADAVLLPVGETRFLGLDQDCARCHEDAHEGRIQRACGECHGQEHPFAFVASFSHEDFSTECAHAGLACSDCHEPGTARAVEALASDAVAPPARACAACHESEHHPEFLQATAMLASVRPAETCALCHSESHASFTGHPELLTPALHEATGFALDRPHNALACTECHQATDGNTLTSFQVADPPRTQDGCTACHGDPHVGQFEDGPHAAQGCLACHAREHFTPSTFGVEAHAANAFSLEASHAGVACTLCHEPAETIEQRQFAGTPQECSACHSDAHRGAFEAFENDEGCARCHQPTEFREYDAGAFEHGDWTAFRLEGAHARADCESCHPRARRADEHGRTFGFAAEHFPGPSERCDTCHADVHAGRFERPELPLTIAGRTDCARCHDQESFAAAAESPFDHALWTGYPMADFHAEVACSDCHLPRATPDALGRTFGTAPKRCADCHEDPHVAQFAIEGATDCARCHQDAGGLLFDHQRDSRFALDERHAALECASCHVPWPLPGGGEAVRYKPLGTECVDCHDPEFLERAERSTPKRKKPLDGFSPRGGGR